MRTPFSLPSFEFAKNTLANGLDVIVRRQPTLPLTAINLWYHVGSKNEERNQRGFTHLFEHLMFEGSQHYPGDFFKHLQPLGANINGSTSSDRTNYFVDLPTPHAERAIAMESDRMANLLAALDDSKLRIQKDVVKNEYRQNYANRPYGMVGALLAEALYPPQHPYSWMTIGVMEDLESATMADVSAFFRRFYVPSNASLSIVGDLDEDAAFSLAERYFGQIPGGTRSLRPWCPEPELARGVELVVHDRVELDRLYLVWHTAPQFDPADAPLAILGDILARGRSSRLYRKLVVEAQVAQDVSAYQNGRELAGAFWIVVTARPGRSLREAVELVDRELETIAADGVTPEELERVKTLRGASFFFALEHIGGFGGVADRLNAYNIYRGDPGLVTADVERFRAVTAGDVATATTRYLIGSPRVALSVFGRKAAAAMPPLDRSAVPPRASVPHFSPPIPHIMTLGSDIPFWVLPKNDLPTISAAIVIPGGASLQPVDQAGLANLTVDLLEEGTHTRTAEELALAVESMGASLSASCGWDGFYVSFRCLRDDLEAILDLALDVLLHPSFPDPEFVRVRGQTLAALKSERDSADSRCYRAFLKAIYGEGHPYRFPLAGTETTVGELARGDLERFHGQLLAASRPVIVMAGDFDPESAARELDKRLPSWAGGGRRASTVPDPGRPDQARILVIDRPGAPQAVLRVGHLGLPRNSPSHDRVQLMNQILGGQFISRLNARLREERGFTYGVRSSFDCRKGAGPFSISASIQSDKIADALEDVRHEVSALSRNRPPTQAELDDARFALIEGQTRQFETPSALVNRYANVIVHDLPVDHEAEFAARLNRIDLPTIIEAAHEHIRPEALVAVVVADASQVLGGLERLDWAQTTVIDE